MQEATTIEEVRQAVAAAKAEGHIVGFVPTMGALHEGHLSLLQIARERAGFVVFSIFVNPTQFGPDEDFATYPRDLDADRKVAAAARPDLLFHPRKSELYPTGLQTKVRVGVLSEPLCGRQRPRHFDGVALIVTKLLNIVRPDFTVFGRKDAQQVLLVARLVRDLHLPGEILGAPTIREEGGLALSSRNRYLDGEERKAALSLSRGLQGAAELWRDGERSGGLLVRTVREALATESLVETEYVEIRERQMLRPWPGGDVPALLAVAARVGRARLIDNVFLGGPGVDDEVIVL